MQMDRFKGEKKSNLSKFLCLKITNNDHNNSSGKRFSASCVSGEEPAAQRGVRQTEGGKESGSAATEHSLLRRGISRGEQAVPECSSQHCLTRQLRPKLCYFSQRLGTKIMSQRLAVIQSLVTGLVTGPRLLSTQVQLQLIYQLLNQNPKYFVNCLKISGHPTSTKELFAPSSCCFLQAFLQPFMAFLSPLLLGFVPLMQCIVRVRQTREGDKGTTWLFFICSAKRGAHFPQLSK